jgi:hypothetical protein
MAQAMMKSGTWRISAAITPHIDGFSDCDEGSVAKKTQSDRLPASVKSTKNRSGVVKAPRKMQEGS